MLWTNVSTLHWRCKQLLGNIQPCGQTRLQSPVELDNWQVQFSHRKLLSKVSSSSSSNLLCHHLLLKTGLAPVSDAKHIVT